MLREKWAAGGSCGFGGVDHKDACLDVTRYIENRRIPQKWCIQSKTCPKTFNRTSLSLFRGADDPEEQKTRLQWRCKDPRVDLKIQQLLAKSVTGKGDELIGFCTVVQGFTTCFGEQRYQRCNFAGRVSLHSSEISSSQL